jgi:hypothetical protein
MFKFVAVNIVAAFAIIFLTTLLAKGDGAASAALIPPNDHPLTGKLMGKQKSAVPQDDVSDAANWLVDIIGFLLCFGSKVTNSGYNH